MLKFILYSSGFICMVIGFFYFICYSNLFTFGYSFKQYFQFMFSHIRNYSLLLGMILTMVALHMKGASKK